MTQEFVPYELAVKLKELGFDEPCFGIYLMKEFRYSSPPMSLKDITDGIDVLAPTFSQVFRWFRDEHGISGSIQIELDAYQWSIFEEGEDTGLVSDNWEGTDYEEAELACLTKLIEIVESKSE